MKPQSSSFWLRQSGVPLFMWCQRRQRLPPTSLERGLKSGRVFHVMVAVKLQRRAQAPVRIELKTSTIYVVPEETAFATYKGGLKSGTVVQVMVAVKLQSTGSSENCTHDPWFTRPCV